MREKGAEIPALLAVPSLIFLLRILLFPGPTGHAALGDPDYGYLLNSLLLATGKVPAHVDHPGTPLQLLGAWFIQLRFLLLGPGTDLAGSVLADPYGYLSAFSLLLAGLLSLSVFLSGAFLRKLPLPLPAVLLLQSCPLWLPDTWSYLVRVSPEVLTPSCALLPALLFLRFLESGGAGARQGALLGAGLGACLSLKLSFLPLLLAPSAVRRRRFLLSVALALAASFLFFTWPVRTEYGRVLSWFLRLALNRGVYGQGAAGLLPAPEELWPNGRFLLLRGSPYFFLSVLFPVAWNSARHLAPERRARARDLIRMSLLVYLLALLMVLKQVGTRYLLPTLFVWALLAGLVLCAMREMPGRLKTRYWAALLIPSALSLAVAALHGRRMWLSGAQRVAAHEQLLREAARHSACGRVLATPVLFPQLALDTGDMLAGRGFSARLRELHPGTISYDAFSGEFRHFGDVLSGEQLHGRLSAYPCIILLGSPGFQSARQSLKLPGGGRGREREVLAPFRATELFRNGDQGLFAIELRGE